MHDYVLSVIRTYVPIAVGSFLTFLAVRFGLEFPADLEDELSIAMVAVVSGLYFAAVRALERRWPWLGWFIGAPRQPTYRAPDRA